MSEDNDENTEKDHLHSIFKELKVDPAWDESKLVAEANRRSVQELWAGSRKHKKMATKEVALTTPSSEPIESGTSETGPTCSKTRSAARRPNLRTRPYPCDDKLPLLSKLSLAQDECTNKHCQCNLVKPTSKDTDQHRLNYARLCSSPGRPRNYIQEAHLKLHHRNKDTRQLIRAARLHLVRGSSNSRIGLVGRSGNALPTLYETPADVFGQGLASEAKDFASLVAEHMSQKGKEAAANREEAGKKDEAVGGVEPDKHQTPSVTAGSKSGPVPTFKGASFDGYRATSVPAAAAPFSFWGGTSTPTLQQESADGINLRDLEEGLLEVSSSVSDQGASAPAASAASRGSSPSDSHCPLHPGRCKRPCTCSDQARLDDFSVDELAGYFDDFVYIPRKMSKMAEMMYT